jgi:plastocyanin
LIGLKILGATAMFVVGLGLSGCSGSNGSTVAMEDLQRFKPKILSVEVGEIVSFVNDSDDAHTVTASEDALPAGVPYFASGGFESEGEARDDTAGGLLSPGERFEVEFGVPGTYRYFCIPHEDSSMVGRIVVEE